MIHLTTETRDELFLTGEIVNRQLDHHAPLDQCEHGINLLETCHDCLWMESYQRFYPMTKEKK